MQHIKQLISIKLLSILFFMSAGFQLFSQNFNWAKGAGGIGNDASNSVSVDTRGNTYITGNIGGKANFSGTEYQGRGVYDVFIAKYNSQGSLVWVKTAGGDANDQGNAIKVKDGFIYITGYFNDTAWFENTMFVSRGDADAFVAKYDLNGNLIWARQAGGLDFDYGSSIDLDNAGNVLVSGKYETAIRIENTNLSSPNIYNESFLACYSTAGQLNWAKTIRGSNTNLITSVAFDNHHSFFIAGYFAGSFKFDSTTINSVNTSFDVVLGKIDANGDLDWLQSNGGGAEDVANGVCADNNGNPSIVGYFAGTAIFGTNSISFLDYNDSYVAHFDSTGLNKWVRAGKGTQLDIGFAIAADDAGNVFATGMFEGAVNFDGQILNGSDRDIFMISYTENGAIRWLTKAGALETEAALSIAVKANGNVVSTGYYLQNCFFGNIQLPYSQNNDIFVAEYDAPFITAIAENELDKLSITVSPNPCANQIYVNINSTENKTLEALIYNAIGVQIAQKWITTNQVNTITTSDLPAGIYFIQIKTDSEISTKRFVKQ